MTKAAVSSILKSIKMNPSGDEGRSRYSSMYAGLNSRYYPDGDRYVRSRTVDAPGYFDRYNSDRYGRRQSRDLSREMRFRSSGSLDRSFPSRLVLDDPIARGYADDRYFADDAHGERYLSPRELPRDASMPRRDDMRFDRYGYEHDRFAYVPEPFGYPRPAYDRPRYGYDYAQADRDYRRHGPDRFAYESRYGIDRTHFEDRYSQDRANQPGRVRFDSEQHTRNDRRRSSAAAREDSVPRDSIRSEEIRSKLPPSGREIEREKDQLSTTRQDTEKISSRRSSERMQERQASRQSSAHAAEEVSQLQGSRKGSSLSRRESDMAQRQLSSKEVDEEFSQAPDKEFERELDPQSSSRRESEKRVSPRPPMRDDFDRRDSSMRLSRRESEREQMQEIQSRTQSDIRVSPHLSSRRESERDFIEEQMSRRQSEKDRQQSITGRESEQDFRLQPPSRRDSERRLSPQPLSRRESERRPSPQPMVRRDSERDFQEVRQKSPMPTSRRDSEREAVQEMMSRRESERDAAQFSRSRRDSERDYLSESRSRRESERMLQQEQVTTDESDRDMRTRRDSEFGSRSRRDSERDMEDGRGSRGESLTRKSDGSQHGSRRGSDFNIETKSALGVDGRRESLQSRDSETRRSSRRGSEKEGAAISDKESEHEVVSTSRRVSERDLRPKSRQEADRQVFSPSRRESERVVLSPSRKGSDYEGRSPARRDSERDGSRSRRMSERQEDNLSRRTSTRVEEKHDSRRSSMKDEKSFPEQRSDGSRSGSRSRKGSEREPQINITRDSDATPSPVQVDNLKDRITATRGKGYFGSQFGADRMPPPIPPYAEHHSNYPVAKEYATREDEQNLMRRHDLAMRVAYNMMRKRYYERSNDPSLNPVLLQHGDNAESFYSVAPPSEDVLRVNNVDFLCSENAKSHKTFDYEMVKDIQQPNPVFRRGQSFFLDINFNDREFDPAYDHAFLNFYAGSSPSVPKRTQAVLPLTFDSEFHRAPYQWDVRFTKKEGNTLSVEVFVPVTSPVGIWRCVVESSTKECPGSKLQHRCAEDIYVVFNPFDEDDAAYMEDDDQRYEYVFKDSGKIYTGGYRNVRGRPWIFGQFDDCVLPAACVLLEMSGLPHAERGNAVKVAKALTSMIKANRSQKELFNQNFSTGLIVPKFEDNYNGGNSPHLWTGSVQIFEEFLRRGIAPVKFGECWVMAGLLTSVCRAFGLAARPVTAFVNAFDSQDTFTVDKYIDRFGDTQENGPNKSKPDLVWSFHSWCEIYLNRTDQPQEYSGWQASDPCSSFREDNESGSCGPCPVEALRRGDIGQDDVASFYSALNAYVRFFYEDDESGWGHSPFGQFRYPMSRCILTKSLGDVDDEGDDDVLDVTRNYCDEQASDAEKFANFNAYRGIVKNMPAFEHQAASSSLLDYDPKGSDQRNFDVKFELQTPERAMIGQSLKIPVLVTNLSQEKRTIQSTICTRSSFYTGTLGSCLKRSSSQLTLEPNQQDTVNMILDSWNYEHKVVGMSFVKITTTGFVQETGQSFVDEFDFRFSKPELNMEIQDGNVGVSHEATFSFKNPLDVPLTECYLTMEVSGSVRPRTIRLNREVRPREIFTYTHSFVPRTAGNRRIVACFTSRQLADVVGHRSVVIHEC